jgi:threonine dehydratase
MTPPPDDISRDAILSVEPLLRPYVRLTPVVELAGSDLGLGVDSLWLKLESLQRSGSFKARGAFTSLLTRDVPPAGVVAASGGNHGAAVACAAQALGIRATIFVPSVSSRVKMDRIRSYGAELFVEGDQYAHALTASRQFAARTGAMEIHAFDQRATLLGQGTVGLELEQQIPELDTVLVAVGGGGLVGGLAAWFGGTVRVVGVEPEAAPTLTRALEAGKPIDAPVGSVAVDSLAPTRVGELMFPIAQRFVDRVLLVNDAAITEAQQRLWSAARVVAEPGGAAATAALLSGLYQPSRSERVAVVVSGGNTNAVQFER